MCLLDKLWKLQWQMQIYVSWLLIYSHLDAACAWSEQILQQFTLPTAEVDVRSLAYWSDATPNRSKMVNSYCNESSPLLMQWARLWRLKSDSTLIILSLSPLSVFVCLVLDVPESSAVIPDCRSSRDNLWHASSCIDANFFLTLLLPMLCRIDCLSPLIIVPLRHYLS